MNLTPVQYTVNGQPKAEFVGPGMTLYSLLRDRSSLFATKSGCHQGTCGACTVLVDGKPVLSCLTLAEAVDGREVETAEHLEQDGELHAIQQAFLEHFAAQCGYCTPGMMMAAKALLDKNPSPTREEVIDAISGNICRCTGYTPIVEAILTASGRMTRQPA